MTHPAPCRRFMRQAGDRFPHSSLRPERTAHKNGGRIGRIVTPCRTPDPAPRHRRHRPPDRRIYSELGYARVNLDRFRDRREWVGSERWEALVRAGEISSWYEGVP